MAADDLWRLPPPDLALSAQAVHLWRAPLEQPAEFIDQCARWLSDEETARAERFHFDRDRRRFTVGRGVLRALLGRYLHIAPEQVAFRYGPQGKPYLSAASDPCELRFNVAHSNELAVYAFTCGREVGVDVEYLHPLPELDQIAAQFFAEGENVVLQRIPEDQRNEAFFRCWTLKEAYIKAIGEGLSHSLDQFEVAFEPAERARLLTVKGDPEEVDRWSMTTLAPAAGYLASLAVEGSGFTLARWQYLAANSSS